MASGPIISWEVDEKNRNSDRLFFACGRSAPVRIEHEGGAAAWLAGTLAVPSVQGHRLPLPQELWPYLSLFFSQMDPFLAKST